VGAHGHRLGQGGVVGRQAVGHFQQQRFRQDHPFGEPARILVGISDRVEPFRTHVDGHRDDAGPGLEAGCPGTALEHLGAELMAEDDVLLGVHAAAGAGAATHLDHVVKVMQGMQVRAADAAGQGPDPHLAGAGIAFLDGVADQFPGAPHDCPHGRSPCCFEAG